MRALAAVGPGIFAIGYTIGTGSVTSMAKAGADYGLGLFAHDGVANHPGDLGMRRLAELILAGFEKVK